MTEHISKAMQHPWIAVSTSARRFLVPKAQRYRGAALLFSALCVENHPVENTERWETNKYASMPPASSFPLPARISPSAHFLHWAFPQLSPRFLFQRQIRHARPGPQTSWWEQQQQRSQQDHVGRHCDSGLLHLARSDHQEHGECQGLTGCWRHREVGRHLQKQRRQVSDSLFIGRIGPGCSCPFLIVGSIVEHPWKPFVPICKRREVDNGFQSYSP